MYRNWTRRSFIGNALLGMIAAGVSSSGSTQSALEMRPDWETFKRGKNYSSFMDAIRKMRANTNAADKRSWQYWVNAHLNFCPHNIGYFLAWHRGYLKLFERQLREVSGNPALIMPYWDYYTGSSLPAEFLDAASWNPLYVDRINTDVRPALTLAPFDSTLVNFQRDAANAFEPSLETQPHNAIHDLIGGFMPTLQSPTDPIFWVHHANLDRLLNAWVAAGGGRSMPAATDAYWSGTFNYAARLTLPISATVDTRTNLGYFYDNERLPTSLPSAITGDPTLLASRAGRAANDGTRSPPRPPFGNFPASGRRAVDRSRMALGGVLDVPLGRASVSARIVLDRTATRMLAEMVKSFRASPFATALPTPQQFTSVKVVLTDVKMTAAGAKGGYFYKLYLNLPDTQDTAGPETTYLTGDLGPFRVVTHMHHGHIAMGVTLEFDITDLIRASGKLDLSEHSFSFVRVNGANSPAGEVITVGEVRLELA